MLEVEVAFLLLLQLVPVMVLSQAMGLNRTFTIGKHDLLLSGDAIGVIHNE